jgi:hypothetical protein
MIGEMVGIIAAQPATPMYSANLIPAMTGYNTPTGIVSASSEISPDNYPAWRAFDGNLGGLPFFPTYPDVWAGGINDLNPWIAYDFGSGNGKVISKYALRASGSTFSYNLCMPISWTFEGWDGAAWVVLDTQTNVPTWGFDERREYAFGNATPYEAYRLNVLYFDYLNAYNYMVINEIEMMSGG